MLVNDIVNSCAHEKVAEAALASIGASFHDRVRSAARCRSQSAGAFAATTIASFRLSAHHDDYTELQDAIRGADQPVLSGLRMIIERELRREDIRAA